ncbi:uncharacterized protein UV8b_01724 [Ustilaginoidea virens]|uniref:Fe2OG dioxygenase domain-containing protein n=1 Tax=Ustilaginoidea virens TaxID=1159556 RepID=A0A8E5HLG9_USTVR|nr:uncharacterized protein UV8b_01724 [Ustilaginoidea virens]QUC17483.1 hypothetical protein UV8b_01724 [Ustilaginoidea virens]
MAEQIPVVDLSAYAASAPASPASQRAAQLLHQAASQWGFFLLANTPVRPASQAALVAASRAFFALPEEDKLALDVRAGGPAWRGYMPLGGEHTHGRLDWKEGLYVGPEHADSHPLFGMPLHGKNQFPDEALPQMRPAVLDYLAQVTELANTLADMFSAALGLGSAELRRRLLEPEPIVLFRCFSYAAAREHEPVDESYGIGQHTDFGFLTILMADAPGLQILSPSDRWVDVPVIPDTFIVNVGDMFDQLTGGRYPSRPHRVRRPPPGSPPRLSFPLFFDFSWGADMQRLPLDHLPPLSDEERQRAEQRWAATTFRDVRGTWAQYLARKVQKVFPDLGLPDFEPNAAPSTRFTRAVDLSSS